MMGLFDKLRAELIDIIEWLDDSRTTLVWRFPRYQNEIKNGAQLIVRPGQIAVFVYRGQIADVFEPGNYQLKSENLPILGTLLGWKYGFNSPFRSEVYFVSTRQITDLKWGTQNPVMLRDPEFGPIRLRAFGTYALKAVDAKALLKELVGTDGEVEADEIGELLRSIIVSTMSTILGEQQIAALDLAANYRGMSETLRKAVQEQIDDEYGLAIPNLQIVNISFPEAVEKALDTRSSMGVIGDMNKFQQYKFGEAMGDAANNPNGGAGDGLGMGMGFAMASRFMGQPGYVAPGAAGGAPAAGGPPPIPGAVQWHVALSGQTMGPYTPAQVQQAIQTGQLNREALVWSAGMDQWEPAGQSPLASLFTVSPPPLPPTP
jgi:membrane protease subunit (stomatin/prohibitin family)